MFGIGRWFRGKAPDIRQMQTADAAAAAKLHAQSFARGWSEEDLAGLACRNALRVLRAADAVAARS